MAAAETIESISINQLIPSKSNPRKTFNEASLQDLAKSIEKFGVMQPILVQRHPDLNAYEIIAGERRFRASQLAGLNQVPARIVQVSPLEMLEMQVIENLQREDVHPLEEAEGYEALIRASSKTVSVEDIAARVGKSKAYVYQRMQLCKLQPACRDAFYAGRLGASVALLLSRIPVSEMQVEALEELLDGASEDETISLSEARWHIQREYMTKLANAPFDIASEMLVPEAGSCQNCEKRTGAEPELFTEIASNEDICTDITCFRKKTAEHRVWLVKDLTSKGLTVLQGAEAKKILTPYGGLKGYIHADHSCYAAPRIKDNDGDEIYQDYDQVLSDSGVEPIYVEAEQYGTTQLVKVYPEDAAQEYLTSIGIISKVALTGNSEYEKSQQRIKEECTYRKQLFLNTHAAMVAKHTDFEPVVDELADANARMVANSLLSFVDNEDSRTLLKKAWSWDKSTDLAEQIKTLSIGHVAILVIEMSIMRETRYMWEGSPPATQLIELAKRYGVETHKTKVQRAAPKKSRSTKQKEAA